MKNEETAKINLNAIADDIDYDAPEMTDEEIANAEWFIEGGDRETILLTFDKFVLEYFRKKGNGYREYMNNALKDYVLSQEKLEAEKA